MRALVTMLLLGGSLLACPAAGTTDAAPSKQASCTHVGQSCEFSPGKLGSCVAKESCAEPQPSCFVCQSQH